MRDRVHNFTQHIQGRDYVIEPVQPANEGKGFYMTGYGRGIRPNDYIVLRVGGAPVHYRVEQIDYYCDPSNMWIAQLMQCGSIQSKE